MARVFITGSADGLGRAAAETLLAEGHEVIVHARSAERLTAVKHLPGVTGDLADLGETRAVAEQVNALGRPDVVIHNAGVYRDAQVMPVNVVAPYVLTALIDGPGRLIYLTSGMHRGGRPDVRALRDGSYSDSKLFVTTLALAMARLRPGILSNAVDPGWVPTRMGGPGAPDDLRLGHLTQEWLATSDDPAALTTGGYWYHQQRHDPHPSAADPGFQDRLLAALADLTGTPLP
ncbi:SDR family NAD(P)-dependent oxidoreductase [Paractinoplanes atraurantiacus]|uniref:NAD(P)-dependent dehydrogenase, short-chain alcohol dehydrogenase family n=1 Tax=Paractinoplanes atraurantiacus TaxID=1036182 RepID=A0A285J7S3_9ACTN|nr:SDR family NAD(P)-dependent oxidoreductase [Actinoplanes atraurantiacus]SNY55386.1 NAD(P)-dependent dehydrogenase, short-chain alcohol dehydrogenase family [Actinoplanes atraurantiacus]